MSPLARTSAIEAEMAAPCPTVIKRGQAINGSDHAIGKGALAFALASRPDVDTDHVLMALASAPMGMDAHCALAWSARIVTSHPDSQGVRHGH